MRLGGVAVRALIAFLVCAVLLGLSATSASAAEVGYGEYSFGYDGRAFDYDHAVTNPPSIADVDDRVGSDAPPSVEQWQSSDFVAPGSAGQQIFRAVEPAELAELVGSGQYKALPGQTGKYFFPTQAQADNFADMMKGAGMGGPFCTTSGCIPASVLDGIEPVFPAGEGMAYFIPEEFLPLIDDIVIHGN